MLIKIYVNFIFIVSCLEFKFIIENVYNFVFYYFNQREKMLGYNFCYIILFEELFYNFF